MAFIVDIKNELGIENHKWFFDGQNQLFFEATLIGNLGRTLKLRMKKKRILKQKTHNGWKYMNKIFTYIKPNNNKYLIKLLWKMENNKGLVILGVI